MILEHRIVRLRDLVCTRFARDYNKGLAVVTLRLHLQEASANYRCCEPDANLSLISRPIMAGQRVSLGPVINIWFAKVVAYRYSLQCTNGSRYQVNITASKGKVKRRVECHRTP
jgi:hypothetical protein